MAIPESRAGTSLEYNMGRIVLLFIANRNGTKCLHTSATPKRFLTGV